MRCQPDSIGFVSSVELEMLFEPPRLTPQDLDTISRISEVQASLRYATQDPVAWESLLRRISMAKAVQASIGLDGYHVTEDVALAAWMGEQWPDTSSSGWQAFRGYRLAMTYVHCLAADPHFSFSPDLVRGLHFMMLHFDSGHHPGQWRPRPVFLRDERTQEVVYEGPDATEVPILMRELANSLAGNSFGAGRIVEAAVAHFNLLMSHPFSRGNGRMARCLQTLILARAQPSKPEYSGIEEYLGRNAADYFTLLAEVGGNKWSPQGDTLPWVRFCLQAHFRQAVLMMRRSRGLGRLWGELETEAERHKLPPRVVSALADAALGYKVRNASYRRVADIKTDLASKDLKTLVSCRLLEAKGNGREGTTWYPISPERFDSALDTSRSKPQWQTKIRSNYPRAVSAGCRCANSVPRNAMQPMSSQFVTIDSLPGKTFWPRPEPGRERSYSGSKRTCTPFSARWSSYSRFRTGQALNAHYSLTGRQLEVQLGLPDGQASHPLNDLADLRQSGSGRQPSADAAR